MIYEIFNDRLGKIEDKYNLHHIVQHIKRTKKDRLFTARNLLLLLSETVPQYAKQIKEIVSDLNIGIFFNKIRSTSNTEISDIYPLIIKNYFGFRIESIGELPYSEVLLTTTPQMIPIVTNEKGGEFVEMLVPIVSRLISLLSKDARREE